MTASPIHSRRPALGGGATVFTSVLQAHTNIPNGLYPARSAFVKPGLTLVAACRYIPFGTDLVATGRYGETQDETAHEGTRRHPPEAVERRLRGDLPVRIPGREPRTDPGQGGRDQGRPVSSLRRQGSARLRGGRRGGEGT